ncbi:transmembrane protein 236 [Nelusetta ayraudi]|uniref:transmembrane protein 236 n=1 Tax=Nelusetta ayraudi TaxID=303726 RepID=UPI003F71221C
MPSRKTAKLVAYELLQFAALVAPPLTVVEKFARLVQLQNGLTSYWLVVAASIAYVTSVTLLAWLPLKYVVRKRRTTTSENQQWRPTMLAYIILCTLPCFAVILAGSKMDRKNGLDYFSELPVSLVLFALITVDVVERIRPFKLLGQSDPLQADYDTSGLVLTRQQHVTTVSDQQEQGTLTLEDKNGITPSRSASSSYLYVMSPRSRSHSGPLGSLWTRDQRAEVFVESFMFWLDTVEMVRVAGEPSVFYSDWVFPVYIFCFLSTLRLVITPSSPLLVSAGVFLQDLPFFFLRVALIAVFGFVSPLLYPLKNLLVCLTFIYFTFLTKLRIFRRHSMF